jgi:predicted site-specific integrase-resolvase
LHLLQQLQPEETLKMYTTKEAAKALGVKPQTVRRYTRLAQCPLQAQQIGLRKDLRIREDALITFAEKHGMAIILQPQQ